MMNYETTKAIVSEHFTCNPATGEVLRKIPSNKLKAGDVVGHRLVNGYMAVVLPVLRRKVYCHHVVFYLMTGTWPPETGLMIDHINQVRDDNRIKNLRLADGSLNSLNSNVATGSSEYMTKDGVRFKAQLRVRGVCFMRAGFLSSSEASCWYRTEKQRHLSELVG